MSSSHSPKLEAMRSTRASSTRSRTTFLQVGTAYFWGRLEEEAAAQGSLAPAPQVTADTDSTGPNYWIGLSWRLGAAH